MIYSELSAHLTAFARILREKGLPVGPVEEADALRALRLIQIGDPDQFRLALRTIFTGSRKEQDFFDQAYDAYWTGKSEPALFHGQEEIELRMKRPSLKKQKQNPINRTLLNWTPVQEAQEEEAAPGYSPLEVLTKKDFSKFTEGDFTEAVKVIREMVRILSHQASRRYQKSTRRRHIDFRRTMRLTLRNAGEIMELAFRERSLRKLKLVLLCDVSGSMENYSRFMITFAHVLQQAYGRIETFAFSTTLHSLTGILKRQSITDALEEISESIPDWSGGTRIGFCLRTFLDDDFGALLRKDTVVIILSDGWDIGELDVMEQSMKEIHQKVNRVIWLNPLLGSPDYEPNCLGMQSALPYIDDFLPAHNLESLRELCNHLVSVRRRKGLHRVH